MKSLGTIIIILFAIGYAHAQTTISYHHSSLPFIGMNHQFGKFIPELRVGTDDYIEDISLELAINYKLVEKESHECYAGLGGRVQNFAGLVLPVGINVYPFDNKSFGFQMELAGLLGNHGAVLRGSWGIRYQLN